jgi:alpha-glucosidase
MVLLDSHDTARMRTVVSGDRKAHLSAMTAMLTYPGVPSIFAGDEIGLEGSWGEDSRRTINWEDRSGWDHDFLAEAKKLIELRRTQDGLIEGGLRWVAVEDNFICYLRESNKQSVLVFISRKAVRTEIDLAGYGLKVVKTLYGPDATGASIKIDSDGATQGIWEVKS